MTFFKEQRRRLHSFYQGEFSYYLRITAIAFLILAVASFFVGIAVPKLSGSVVEQFAQEVTDLGIVQEDGTLLATGLFANNLRATIIGMVYGLIPMIYLPALSLGINSTMLGIFAAYSVQNGLSIWYYLLGILPHGIFELPALVISLAMGLYLCRCTTLCVRKKEQGIVKASLQECTRVVLMHMVPLLLVAAFVEAYITPRILALFT